ncbi:Uncharacterised protein [Mycobacteroides abscessus subsp. abscessus]|nr:Uncharacterised protein [Mycobacteroides abscessus subsp. abscessus]
MSAILEMSHLATWRRERVLARAAYPVLKPASSLCRAGFLVARLPRFIRHRIRR